MQKTLTKQRRQSRILALVQSRPVLNQDALARQLSGEGIRVTQATLSRDLHDLNLIKTAEGYKLPNQLIPRSGNTRQYQETIAHFMTEVAVAGNLVVVKTNPGNASPVARCLDSIGWSEILGTVAGDDTILVVTKGASASRTVQNRLLRVLE